MTKQDDVKIMERIQAKAARVSKFREELACGITELDIAQVALKARHYQTIKVTFRSVIKEQEELAELIKANASLFDSPKTQTVDNLRFGLRKQKGKTVWDDDAALVEGINALIKKGEIDEELSIQLIKVSKKPVVSAIEKLDGKVLKKLGVTIEDATDAVVISTVDSEINKLLDNMLKSASIVELEEDQEVEGVE